MPAQTPDRGGSLGAGYQCCHMAVRPGPGEEELYRHLQKKVAVATGSYSRMEANIPAKGALKPQHQHWKASVAPGPSTAPACRRHGHCRRQDDQSKAGSHDQSDGGRAPITQELSEP